MGIKLSKKMVKFLDSDDYWSSKKLEKSIIKLKNNIDVICHNEWIVDLENKTKNMELRAYESHFYKKILFTETGSAL